MINKMNIKRTVKESKHNHQKKILNQTINYQIIIDYNQYKVLINFQ